MFKTVAFFLTLAVLGHGAPTESDWRVVGGAPAELGQVPHQVSLRSALNSHFCGGSIIGPRTILTAAHCLVGRSPANTVVYTGTTKLNAGGNKYQAAKIVTHAQYDAWKIKNDVGLVLLDVDIEFSENVGAIGYSGNDVGGDVPVVLSGWGRTSYPGNIPNDLQFVELKTLTFPDCKSKLSSVNEVFDSQICTLTKAGEGACHGDSGGPLTLGDEVVGIVSWGSPCARGYPDVFTRVSSFAEWIEENKA